MRLVRLVLIVSCVLAASLPIVGQGRLPVASVTFDVTEKSIEELQQALAAKQVTSRQLVDLYLARIKAYDQSGPSLNAIVAVNPDARHAADALDAERASKGSRGPLHGIPLLVKDNYETLEMPTTAGSVALATFHPRRDAFMVRKLKDAGAIVLGKTAMHELAAGILTVGSGFGQTRNPYDLDRTPGGSSGGTGAAIAASFAAAGMGSDTCGSIRIPAANNGLVGLRGTQGLSSRTGIVPLSSTQDIGGPITRRITDLAILLDATVGPDPADAQTTATAGKIPGSYRAGLRADALKGARIGVVRNLFGSAPEDQEVTTVINKSLEAITKAGSEVLDVVIPGLDELLRDSSMINSDFKFDLMEYLARSENPPVTSLADILDRGMYHSALESTFRARNAVETRDSEQSRRARIKQATIRQVTEALLNEQRLDALVYPTLRRKPARIGEAQAGTTCQLSAHSGLPTLAVPAGLSEDGVPIGMEFLGAAFSEQRLLSLGYATEQTLNLRRPPFSTPALVAGKPPGLRTVTVKTDNDVLTLRYDETTSRLRYSLTLDPKSNPPIASVWLHSGTAEKPAAGRHRLHGVDGEVTLSSTDRRDLADGRLMARVYRQGRAGSSGDFRVQFPAK
ncbi:MAG: amidase [Acidobacteria bacterium]|nr:amidase [Acidobacteriota bacterium]